MVSAVGGTDELLELIIEAFVAKVTLLFRHPLLQSEVRLDLELRHGFRSHVFVVRDPSPVLTKLIAQLSLQRCQNWNNGYAGVEFICANDEI